MATAYERYRLMNSFGCANQITSIGNVGIKEGMEGEYIRRLEDRVIELEEKLKDKGELK